ncbi:regulatory protein ToxS [Thaumasiovibrio subtropicus]|uniref:regulatory protein ToxS n=1 Tax=Thaumasiovibrio subtropicus TaxID=1891207 RepID=UPI000B361389|nr:regulatory protein ToxS [Thaumasiovibrio subtropicus]
MRTNQKSSAIKQWWSLGLLFMVCLGSLWYYTASDIKIEQMLSAHKWQSVSVSEIEPREQTHSSNLQNLQRLESTSQVIFLPNKTFSRFTHLTLESDDSENVLQLHISETGNWQVSGKYLQTEITDISDVVSGNNGLLNPEELDYIRHYYIIDSKQSRKLDVLNNKSILLTSLNNGSSILVAQ